MANPCYGSPHDTQMVAPLLFQMFAAASFAGVGELWRATQSFPMPIDGFSSPPSLTSPPPQYRRSAKLGLSKVVQGTCAKVVPLKNGDKSCDKI